MKKPPCYARQNATSAPAALSSVCQECGCAFRSDQAHQTFCSPSCRTKWHHRRRQRGLELRAWQLTAARGHWGPACARKFAYRALAAAERWEREDRRRLGDGRVGAGRGVAIMPGEVAE